MKNVSEVIVSEKVLRLREIKKDASRRCRARAKAIAAGNLLSPDLTIRSLQPTALKLENFKVQLENKTVRLNKNGGSAIALVTTEVTPNGIVRSRKSFKDLAMAVTAFNKLVIA